MRIPDQLIRQKYFEKLNNIAVSGVGTVPIYDVVPETDSELTSVYMKIGRQTYQEQGSKSNFGGIYTVDVEIFQRFTRGSVGGRAKIDAVSNAVGLLISDSVQNYLDLSPNFKNFVTTLSSNVDIETTQDTNTQVQRTLTFSHLIYELN